MYDGCMSEPPPNPPPEPPPILEYAKPRQAPGYLAVILYCWAGFDGLSGVGLAIVGGLVIWSGDFCTGGVLSFLGVGLVIWGIVTFKSNWAFG